MNIIGILFALGAGIFFGIIGPLTKNAYNLGAGVGLAIFLRYLVALIIISPAIPRQKNLLFVYKQNIKDFIMITSGSIMLTIGLLLSVKYINVSIAIIVFCTYPIIVLITSIFITKEKIKNSIIILFITTFLGLFLALSPSFENLDFIGVLFAFIASIGASIMIVVNQTMAKKNITPIQINIFINLTNTIFFLIFLNLFFSINFNIGWKAFGILLIPSLSYAIALFLQLFAIPRIGQTKTALFLYLEPITGILGAVILLNEVLNNTQIIGTCIVILSLTASTYFSKKN
ncbi:MAG: hypothetical protein CFH15_01275 [Alphaproteobacteria bacterium MarineAlpha5_Bin5]|nr:MAG: hypothetical protein CFH15_01275 [Alphaproteobacteria bacterium MarineAlpha5_Bin5]|tara:strand:- start:1269 stop:2132 length:864 start_codon:yes stop_codon:yes gene_type:complete